VTGSRRLNALLDAGFGATRGRCQFGLTLLELLITLSIAAILVTLGVPGFQDLIRNNRAATQSNELLTALNLARSEAIKRGARVSVCASNDPLATTPTCSNNWTQGWIVFTDTATTETSVVVGQVLRVWPALPTTSVTATVDSIRFNGIGGVFTGTELVFTLKPKGCTGTQARTIRVNAIGRAAVAAATCSE
jgi:type IV fimbrial biogenesis protein FimT